MDQIDKLIKKMKVEVCIVECLMNMTDKSASQKELKERLEILKRMRKALEDKPLE